MKSSPPNKIYIYIYKAAEEGEAQELWVPQEPQKEQDRNFDLSKL